MQQELTNTRELRDQLVNRVDVLDKVKKIETLKGYEELTTKMVAKYYGVSEPTIQALKTRHTDELAADGIRTIKGDELTNIKLVSGQSVNARALTIFTRRAVLRIGMLLKESEVAKAVRSYLLNAEANQSVGRVDVVENKNSKTWNNENKQILMDLVCETVRKGGTLQDGLRNASIKLKISKIACQGKWYKELKNECPSDVAMMIDRGAKKNETTSNTSQMSSTVEKENNNPQKQMQFNYDMQTLITLIGDLKLGNEDVFQLRMRIVELETELASKDEIIHTLKESNRDKDIKYEMLSKELAESNKEKHEWKKRASSYANALKMLRGEDQMMEEFEKPSFKMSANGNLERIK